MFAITKRLLLRPAWREDAPALCDAIAEERIVRNLATAPWPYRIEDAERFLTAPRDIRYPNFVITDRKADPSRLIGGVGFHDSGDGTPELGYWLAPDRWGEGVTTEAARAAIAAVRASLGYRRIVAGHFVDNPASGRVLEKLGFRRTGQSARKHSLARGYEAECVMFALDEDADEGEPQMAPALAA